MHVLIKLIFIYEYKVVVIIVVPRGLLVNLRSLHLLDDAVLLDHASIQKFILLLHLRLIEHMVDSDALGLRLAETQLLRFKVKLIHLQTSFVFAFIELLDGHIMIAF